MQRERTSSSTSSSWQSTPGRGSTDWPFERGSSSTDAFLPKFGALLGNSVFEDIQVVIQEETLQANAAKQQEPAGSLTMPASKVVLYTMSEFVRNKVDNWSTTEAAQKQLLLLVPPGQLCTGRLLVEAMYMDAPDLSHLGLGELLQLLALADSYSVPKVVGFAAAALAEVTADGPLPWEGSMTVLQLPDACLALPGCEEMRATAVEQLQQELGDLEVVWGDSCKAERLLGLPFEGLQHLLSSASTAVACEDTAVYSVGRWLEVHPGTGQGQVDDLSQQLRLPHCTPNYLAGVIATPSHWLQASSVSLRDLALAACMAAACMEGPARCFEEDRENQDHDNFWEAGEYHHGTTEEGWQGVGCSMDWPPRQLASRDWMQLHPAWSLEPRPVSKVSSLSLSWQVPLSQVQQLYVEAQQDTQGMPRRGVCPESTIWQARPFALTPSVSNQACRAAVMVRQPQGQLSALEVKLSVARGGSRSGLAYSGWWAGTVEGADGCMGAWAP